ncbi:protein kinase [Paraliomyxa miuraensis]|uniref:protein kinase n=1 Tax=Paraliomyxa miuraensis TaxID=376150 RepID=UPI002252C1D4|nr:protein kinase [Paraliomyxa miuraensis]MCX4243720.1 protein kinase [Paraliomyxa miuraensis]
MSDRFVEQPLFVARHKLVSLGRYALRRKVGAGISGTVWAAYDPELDREVAVTLMRTKSEAREALAEHAAAWAQLDHPNVAKILDVGLFLDPRDEAGRRMGVFLARDFVAGLDLQSWIDRRPTTRDEAETKQILAMFCAVGRGLAAAHTAGLVHGDCCPASMIVGRDGVVRLVDFAGAGARPMNPSDRDPMPRYPAPETRRGAKPDEYADQFGFCSALWNALRRDPDAELEPRLALAIQRGMAERPEDRWPSMDDLLQELQRRPSLWIRTTSALRAVPKRRTPHRGFGSH